jgi:hypothetical protein
VLQRLERAGLRPHTLENGVLRPFRVAGRHLELTNVFAASAAARERLSALGLIRAA